VTERATARPSSIRASATPGDRLDYSIERQRHAGFVGREAVLAKLDQLGLLQMFGALVEDPAS
jgi:hypothetical protein